MYEDIEKIFSRRSINFNAYAILLGTFLATQTLWGHVVQLYIGQLVIFSSIFDDRYRPVLTSLFVYSLLLNTMQFVA